MTTNTENILQTLEHIAKNTSIVSATKFRHPDLESVRLSRNRNSALDTRKGHVILRRQLTGFLYGRYYNNAVVSMAEQPENSLFYAMADPALLESLQHANQGRGVYQHGWKVTKLTSATHLCVQKGPITLWVNKETHLPPTQRQAKVNEIVSVRFPKERMFFMPGFYLALGNEMLDHRSMVVRFYFHIDPAIAPELVARLTNSLNRAGIPFQLKILSNPQLYTRYDCAILYINKKHYSQTRHFVGQTYSSLCNLFRPEVPLFTKSIYPGLSVAEQPVASADITRLDSKSDYFLYLSESFGEHRCKLIAEGLIKEHLSGNRSYKGKLTGIIQEFEDAQLDLEKLYLNPGSKDIYT